MKRMTSRLYKHTVKVATIEGLFDHRVELIDTLRQAPPCQETPACGRVSSSRRLHSSRQATPGLHDYTPSGVWRWVRRAGVKLRNARIHQYSPDPD